MLEQTGMEIRIQTHLKVFGFLNFILSTFQPALYNMEDNQAIALLVNEPG